jgi:hypothetical protein
VVDPNELTGPETGHRQSVHAFVVATEAERIVSDTSWVSGEAAEGRRFSEAPSSADSRPCQGDGDGDRRETAKHPEGTIVYQADRGTCDACPLKAQSTSSKEGRRIHRSIDEDYLWISPFSNNRRPSSSRQAIPASLAHS